MATPTTNGSVANASFQTRMNTLKQLAQETGIRLPSTIIPEGESLIPYGEERQRALKEEIYSLPTIAQAAERIREVRMEQQPKDVTVSLAGIRMAKTNGGLYGKGHEAYDNKALAYTETSFAQAVAFVKPESVRGGFHQTLLALPPAIRSDAFNFFADNAPTKDVVLRTVMAPQRTGQDIGLRRTLSAVVSERYSVVEDYDLAADLNYALPDGARVRYTATEGRSDLEVLWPAMSRELKVGDIALIALSITNSQTKQHSIKLTPKILRVLCLNFTTAWGEGADTEISIMHMGEARRKFAEAIKLVLATIEPFVHAFGDAYQSRIPGTFTRADVIGKAVKAFELPQKFGAAISGVWDADGAQSAGNTLAGLANAMTRAAQTLTIERAEPVEQAAGRLVRGGWAELGL